MLRRRAGVHEGFWLLPWGCEGPSPSPAWVLSAFREGSASGSSAVAAAFVR